MTVSSGLRSRVPVSAKALLLWLIFFALVWLAGRLRVELPQLLPSSSDLFSGQPHSKNPAHSHAPYKPPAKPIPWDTDKPAAPPAAPPRAPPPARNVVIVPVAPLPANPPPPPPRVGPPAETEEERLAREAMENAAMRSEMRGPNGPLWCSKTLLEQSSPTANRLQRILSTLQHPQPAKSCRHIRQLVHYSDSENIADVAHELALSLKIAILTGRTLVMHTRADQAFGSLKCNGAAFNCYFAPLSNCTIHDVWEYKRDKSKHPRPFVQGDSTARVVTINARKALESGELWNRTPIFGFEFHSELWVVGQLIAYALRPSVRTATQVAQFWIGRYPRWNEPWAMMYLDDSGQYSPEDFNFQQYIERYNKRMEELRRADPVVASTSFPPPRGLMLASVGGAAHYAERSAFGQNLPVVTWITSMPIDPRYLKKSEKEDLVRQQTIVQLYATLVAEHYFLPMAHPYGRLLLELSYFSRVRDEPMQEPIETGLRYSVTNMDDAEWSLRA